MRILLLLLLCPLLLQAQQPSITFRVKNGEGKPVRVMKPMDGRFFVAFPPEDTLDARGALELPNTEKVPGAYGFNYKRMYRLYVRPGKPYEVTVDDGKVQFEGPDKAGQLALLSLDFDFYQSRAMRYYREDTAFAVNRQRVLKEMDSVLQPFSRLYAARRIDQDFYSYAENLIRNYYASVLGATLVLPLQKMEFHPDSARYDASAITEMHARWKDVLAIADPANPASMATDTYLDYSNFYNMWYLGYLLPRSKGVELPKGEAYARQGYTILQQAYTKEPLREYLLASKIKYMLLEERFESFIPEVYDDFIAEYPNSIYTPLLTEGVAYVKAFLKSREADFTEQQRFVEDYASIKTVDELAARFKDNTVYLDLWATWCGPCKAQFAYNGPLKKFLKKKGIKALYVSIDRESAQQQWETMIRFYDLEGYHLRASQQLSDDLRKVFGKSGALFIPRYAILKNGKIVVPDALSPSRKDALYQQLESYL